MIVYRIFVASFDAQARVTKNAYSLHGAIFPISRRLLQPQHSSRERSL